MEVIIESSEDDQGNFPRGNMHYIETWHMHTYTLNNSIQIKNIYFNFHNILHNLIIAQT